MAKKVNVSAKAKTKPANKLAGIFGQLRDLGANISTQKSKLWDQGTKVGEPLLASDFAIFRLGEYEGSIYAVIRDGEESILIPFMRGELDMEDLVVDDFNNIDASASGLDEQLFQIYEVVALRDDDDFNIAEGDTAFRLFVA